MTIKGSINLISEYDTYIDKRLDRILSYLSVNNIIKSYRVRINGLQNIVIIIEMCNENDYGMIILGIEKLFNNYTAIWKILKQ